MGRSSNNVAILICAFFIMQILAPLSYAKEVELPKIEVNDSEELTALEEITMYPSNELKNGWFSTDVSAGEITLIYRDASIIPLENWQSWTSVDSLNGRYIITHQFPIPTEWKYQLSDAGIDCNSFMPPNGFSCQFNSVSIEKLAELQVEGVLELDPVDKIRHGLAQSIAEKGKVNLDIILSGHRLPEKILEQENILLFSHSGRFASVYTDIKGVKWLASQGEVEWLEEMPVSFLVNSVSNTIINSDDVQDNLKMSGLDGTWTGLDGSGIIVTVADSGLDSGVNDGTMHPDFSDHIHDIHSWPQPPWRCVWNSAVDPGPCDDGAIDDNGHGTHVAGSVLGDGTVSTGSIVGIAQEALLHFHAFEQSNTLGGQPLDLNDFFDSAVENGSRIHTNSWGSCDNRPGGRGTPCDTYNLYSSNSMEIDIGARTHEELIIMFANGNDGDVYGAVTEDTLLYEATAKNSISIGASENYRPAYGSDSDNLSGMADFSGRGPTEDGRIKPDFVAPGTQILSTKSRSAGACGWGAYDADYCYMGGTSMATPIAAGATALLLEHLIENEGITNPTSSLVKAIFGASSHDMMGQYSSPTIGAGKAIPNVHEGNGLLNMYSAVQSSFFQGESVTTGDDSGWSFTLPSNPHDLQIGLAYIDPEGTPGVTPYLVNDLDLAVKSPAGVWTNLTDDLNNLRVMNFSSPDAGTWEVHIIGTTVAVGPQFFSLAINHNVPLVNLTEDADLDGVEDSMDDCPIIYGTSIADRTGCLDSDGDGYSDPDGVWTTANGADAFIAEPSQWADQDSDTFGDNPAGFQADDCPIAPGSSHIDRFGCADADSDGFSDPDGGWLVGNGADSCPSVIGNSTVDRSGCPDEDGDGYSTPDPSGNDGPVWTVGDGADEFVGDKTQWVDDDADGVGDNPPPGAPDGDSCPGVQGFSTEDRNGCPDSDGDGYSDPDMGWTIGDGADAFAGESTQWNDTDGDGYGDNTAGVNGDDCPLVHGTSTQLGTLGCLDSDGDGYADSDDEFDSNPNQWEDADNDGYGDEPGHPDSDLCLGVQGFSSQDRNGCPDTDGDGYSDPDGVWTTAHGADVWSNDATQWVDADGDGFGDNPLGTDGDDCLGIDGNSTNDRQGCTDTDGDGYSDPDLGWTVDDGADAFPSDDSVWADADGDGVEDVAADSCPGVFGSSTEDREGCPDTDGDGYSDSDSTWTINDGADVFPDDATQWNDSDSDGYGDEPTGPLADDCPNQWGDSWQNKQGCLDTDQDGWADEEDAQSNEPTQWSDVDGDGYGDNLAGVLPDACPGESGNSTNGNRLGCPDDDGDGWDNVIDELPSSKTQWLDQDGDTYGDNALGEQPDSCPGVWGNSTIDRFGCLDDDGDGISNENDAFPDDPTRSQDTDEDGFDDLEDDCISSAGNSTQDRTGCPDTDGDGYSDVTPASEGVTGWNISDGADAFPIEPSQWNDSDGDGFGDNSSGFEADDCPLVEGYSNIDLFGCPDGDNDGTSQGDDAFPNDPTQWQNQDGDQFGDNPNGTNPDACPLVVGTSTIDRYGCPDEDSDGASDDNDLWLGDNTQWFDSDNDSYGDNPNGTMGDACPEIFGTASKGTKTGCIDSDNDGWADIEDDFPTEPSQWLDSDDDGWGDNQTAGAYKLDHWPSDSTRNSGEADLSCSQSIIELDLAGGDWFSFTCTISTEMVNAGVRIEWQAMNGISADTTTQVLIFTPATGSTQTVVFSGQALNAGNFQLVLLAKEPGSQVAMDTITINLEAQDSRLETATIDDQTDAINKLLKEPLFQAALGGLLLFGLMGLLIIRGKSNEIKRNKDRRKHAESVIRNRMAEKNKPAESLRLEFGLNREIPPPPPGFE